MVQQHGRRSQIGCVKSISQNVIIFLRRQVRRVSCSAGGAGLPAKPAGPAKIRGFATGSIDAEIGGQYCALETYSWPLACCHTVRLGSLCRRINVPGTAASRFTKRRGRI
jgi:hypothetical protein